MTTGEEYQKEIFDAMRKQLDAALDDAARERVRESLDNWLSFTAQKRPTADLAQRLDEFRKRIQQLADSFGVDIDAAGYVVKATGDAESTMRMLSRGTSWFNPVSNLTETIVGAIFEQRS